MGFIRGFLRKTKENYQVFFTSQQYYVLVITTVIQEDFKRRWHLVKVEEDVSVVFGLFKNVSCPTRDMTIPLQDNFSGLLCLVKGICLVY